MDFRRANPGDAAAVRRVARRSWHEAYDEIIGEEAVVEKIDEWYDVHALEESVARGDCPMFVAVEDDVIVFAQGGPSEDGPADASLWRIYLLPAYWGEQYRGDAPGTSVRRTPGSRAPRRLGVGHGGQQRRPSVLSKTRLRDPRSAVDRPCWPGDQEPRSPQKSLIPTTVRGNLDLIGVCLQIRTARTSASGAFNSTNHGSSIIASLPVPDGGSSREMDRVANFSQSPPRMPRWVILSGSSTSSASSSVRWPSAMATSRTVFPSASAVFATFAALS